MPFHIHADEGRPYDGRGGVQQEYDRHAPPAQPPDRRGHDERDNRLGQDANRRDRYGRNDGYNQNDGYNRNDGYPQRDHRDQRDRHASVGIGTGNVDVRIDVGGWLAHG